MPKTLSCDTGLGLRHRHSKVLSENPALSPWYEIVTENLMSTNGSFRDQVYAIAEKAPIALHGVSLSIGGTDPLDYDYLKNLKDLAEETKACYVSDHLCWTRVEGINLHDLLPLPYDKSCLVHCINRVKEVQDFLGRQILVENPSSYFEFRQNTMSEAEFLAKLCDGSGCGLLLDVNNIIVTAYNHGLAIDRYLSEIKNCDIGYFHLAGHTHYEGHKIDSHIGPVPEEVLAFYADCLSVFGRKPALLEWDEEIPALEELLQEREKLDQFATRTLGKRRRPAEYLATKNEAEI